MTVATKITAPKTIYTIGETIVATMGVADVRVGGYSWTYGRGDASGGGSGESNILYDGGSTFSVDTSGWTAPPNGQYWTVTISLTSWNEDPNPNGIYGDEDDNYSDANKIGDSRLTFQVYPADIQPPTVSSLGLAEATQRVIDFDINAYVQGVSTLAWDVSAVGNDGADIVDYELSIDGRTYRTKSGTSTPILTSGTVTITAKVTDSRGMVTTATEDIEVLAYSPPKVTSFLIFRATAGGVADDNGVRLKATAAVEAQSLIVGGVEKNFTHYTISNRIRGTESWYSEPAVTAGLTLNISKVLEDIYPLGTAFEMRLTVADALTFQATASTFISKGGVLLDWGEGTMGVGKMWTQGVLDVGGDIYADGEVRTRGSGIVAPAGMVSQFAGATAPAGWLLCDGAAVSRTTYADLFAVIGTTYGAGNGSSTFNLPNLKGRIPIGRDAAQSEFDSLGETGGAKTHSHSLSSSAWAMIRLGATTSLQILMRRISTSSWTATHALTPSATPGASDTTASTSGAELGGRTDADSSLPPYLVMNYIIKV